MAMNELSTPLNFPALLGVYLAVNAVSDAYALVDGPDCALYKAHFIHGRHDWNSSLLRIDGRHRVGFTNVCANSLARDHDELIAERALELAALPDAGAVLLTALPMCSITGVDYGKIARSLEGRAARPVATVEPSSLVGDWLDGFEQALCGLARAIPLTPRRQRPRAAAIIGHLMDRNEADRAANVAELRRILEALGLSVASVWLDGGPVEALSRASEAELVVSLPYGRRAARIVAERTSAALVEAELPFGLPRSARFARQVGEAAGRSKEAEAFVEAELRRAAQRLRWVLPNALFGRRAAFIGDPHLACGFFDLAEDAGMIVDTAVVTHRAAAGAAPEGTLLLCEPPAQSERVRRLFEPPIDLLVSCGFQERRRAPDVELGFPSYGHHALFERPFLGFRGALAFYERAAESLGRRA